jgi:hypothetical protein
MELGVVLHDVLAVGRCRLDVRVELLNVCLELLDAGSLRGVSLPRGVARRHRRELRLELGHAVGEGFARLLTYAELAGGFVETRGEICDACLIRIGNLSGLVGHRRDVCGRDRRAVGRGRRIDRNHAESRGLVLGVVLLCRVAIVRGRKHGPNGRVRKAGVGHRAQTGADAVLGLQQSAVLFCERVRDRTRRCETELDEDLTEWLAGPILLRKRLRQLLGSENPLLDHELAELASVVVGRFHRFPIGLEGPRLKPYARLPGKRPEHKGKPMHPITSVWIPSTRTGGGGAV